MSESGGPREILVTGLTSLRPFAMELENLGNFLIIEPFFRTLHAEFPSARIRTTLQLTPEFEANANIRVLRSRSVWGKSWRAVTAAAISVILAAACALVGRAFGTGAGWLAWSNARLRMVTDVDLVLDFSGDMLGDNAHGLRHLFTGWSTVVVASLLGTPVYAVASSPGPFQRRLRRAAARSTLRRCRMISTRDPVSLDLVGELLPGTAVCHACPSFGFRPLADTPARADLLASEPALRRAEPPVVGLIVAHLNMAEPPLYRWPRSNQELAPFVGLVRFMTDELGLRVCVMSHQNRTDANFELRPGPDHQVVHRLVELAGRDAAFTLRGLYDASSMYRIIGGLDALVSGRVHGAVQGLAQGVPTSIIEYRLPPPAHKHRGFARLAGVERYVGRPDDPRGMQDAVGRLWAEREEVGRRLEQRLPALAAAPGELWRAVREDWRAHRGGAGEASTARSPASPGPNASEVTDGSH